MKFLKNLFAGGVSGLVETVADVADEFTLSPEEKQEFQIKVQEVVARQMEAIEASVRAQFAMVADIIKAEMASGDNYTKRARPTVVYFGLVVIGLNHMILPWVARFAGVDGTPVDLPSEFWYSWSGVTGLWIVGRSAEKAGAHGKVTQSITGSGGGPVDKIMEKLT